MNAPPAEPALRSEILRRLRAGGDTPIPEREFNELALGVFRHQYTCNLPYRAYCDRRNATPQTVEHWTAVPAVPTAAFKATPLVCGSPAEAQRVFRTSGTTSGPERRGEHYLPDLTLYDAALRTRFAAHLLPDGARLRMISLIPSAAEIRDSSLSHMIHEVMQEFGTPESAYYVTSEGIDYRGLIAVLREAEQGGEPVCLLGTSFAYVHLLDSLREEGERFSLPAGSRLMDTGGFKGRARQVSRGELYRAFGEALGIPAEWCVNEYGMTEMSSQFYDAIAGAPETAAPDERLHRIPPWVRSRAVDPETLEILPLGTPGILRHWDLANLGSVMVLQTEDQGICYEGEFRLLGRLAAAEPRGCSIAMDELLTAVRQTHGR